MKKTFLYNFFPSKEKEETSNDSKTPLIVTRRLLEIRDMYSAPVIDPQNSWKIKKVVTHHEMIIGKQVMPFAEVLEHVLGNWTLGSAKLVTLGHKKHVDLWEVTEENNPKTYLNEGTYIEILLSQDNALVCVNLFKDRGLSVDDETGLYWDPMSSNFKFKLIKKGHVMIFLRR
ncbi:hypothetical protein RND71_028750 [Anisodus tanguticus]|uniref:Uncharacterized protein n=1 Tax=Anisodus tanguticus TaxID=243964 RepID=A0AAE1RLK9_9SOLA|nr:hypothetical protein RND71_028750 [Anisodus tanguticus]